MQYVKFNVGTFANHCYLSFQMQIKLQIQITRNHVREFSWPFIKYSVGSEARKRDIELCVICQRKKDAQGSLKLPSTPDGRHHIIQTFQLL